MKPPTPNRSLAQHAEAMGQSLERALDPLATVLKKASLKRGEKDGRQPDPPAAGRRDGAAAQGRQRGVVSSLAVEFPDIPAVAGVEMSAARAGLQRRQRQDVMLMRFAPGTTAAGVFTRHATAAAPVDWCRRQFAVNGGEVAALVANAGCANALTGKAGFDASRRLGAAIAKRLGCRQREVMLAATGQIGVVLDDGRITGRLPKLADNLSPRGWRDAATALMTTDTFPKGAFATAQIEGAPVTIAGIAKGSGMVAPDMATVLAFIVTDAAITPAALQNLVGLYSRMTFNRVTVDGDSSPNDCCMLFATGRSGAPLITRAGDRRLAGFRDQLSAVMLQLAWQVVRDGEGASKFITVDVSGAASPASARRIARAIAESPGVKAAVGGETGNWSRVAAAVGRADEPIRRERLTIRFGPITVVADGVAPSGLDDKALIDYLRRDEVEIAVEAGVGHSSATIWTCDLNRRYVDINQSARS